LRPLRNSQQLSIYCLHLVDHDHLQETLVPQAVFYCGTNGSLIWSMTSPDLKVDFLSQVTSLTT